VSAAAKLPTSLARMKRMRDQGVPLDARTLDAIRAAEAEALTVDDDGAGEPGEAHRVEDAEHEANAAAVDVDCGEHAAAATYRAAVFVTKNGQRFQSRRATSAEPGASDDWEAVGPAPVAPPARASTKAKGVPQWVKLVVDEVRKWGRETFATRPDVEALARSVAELETRCAELENRSGATATASALADAYAGVHVDGKHYERGRLVTFGGSLWLAMRDNDGARPGKSDDWKLIVKHGRDAK